MSNVYEWQPAACVFKTKHIKHLLNLRKSEYKNKQQENVKIFKSCSKFCLYKKLKVLSGSKKIMENGL